MDKIEILVIDDEEVVGLAMQKEFTKEGYGVDIALNGPAAVEMAKKKKYDLAFIDYNMPGGMDGIETCAAMKNISPDTVSIFMTGSIKEKETIEKEIAFVQAGGRVYYLYKPFGEGEIVTVAKKALANRGV